MCRQLFSKQSSRHRCEEKFHKKRILIFFSHFFSCSLQPQINREVAEWLKAHAWKACIWQHIEGSNPFLSAETSFKIIQNLENLNFFGVFSFNTLPKYSFFIIDDGAKSRPWKIVIIRVLLN